MKTFSFALLALLAASPVFAQTATTNVGAPNFATGQATAGATATLLAPQRLGRVSLTVENLGTVPVYLGPAGVTPATGMLLMGAQGQSVVIATTGAVYAVTATGTATLAVGEIY